MHSKFCTQLRLHSNFALIECSRTQIANSLIISEFVCTQSFALNYGCTQTANSLSTTALKLRTHWLSVNSSALKVSHSTAVAYKLRTHWVRPNSNCELIDYQWVRLHSKSRTQPHLNFALKLRTHWLLVSSAALKVSHSTTVKKWINLNYLFNYYQTPNPDWNYKRYFEYVDSQFHLLILSRTLQWFSKSWACFLSKYRKITLNFVENSINIRHFFVNLT